MKYILWQILFLSTAFIAFPSDIISQWNFNSLPPDASTSTGRTAPSMGTGTVTLLGGVTESFVAGGAKDPASADNSAWSVSKFPQVMVSNRMAGVRFQASTAGFERISIGWSQQNSGSASRYARVQYSTDAVTFEDLPAYAILKESTWTNLVFDLAPVSAADDNPNFAFQIVTEFESTAVGGLPGFMPTDPEGNYLHLVQREKPLP